MQIEDFINNNIDIFPDLYLAILPNRQIQNYFYNIIKIYSTVFNIFSL